MRTILLVPALLALAACGDSDNSEAGGVSPAEAEALDRAAELLEAERLPAEALPSAPMSAPVKPAG